MLRWRDDTEAAGILDLPYLESWSLGSSSAPAKKNTREWLRFKLRNSGAAEFPLIVSFDEAFPEEANLYAREPDGSFTMIESGLQVPINERAIKDRVPAFELVIAPGETREVFLSYRTRLEAILGLQVQSPVEFGAWVALQTAGYAFFGGGATAIIIFNLFLFGSLRDPVYLVYSLHASFVVFFVARFSGFTFYIFDTPEIHYVLTSATWIQAMLLVLFTRMLLETGQLSRRVDAGLKAAQIWFAFVAVMTAIDVDFHSVGVRSSLVLTLSFLGVGVYSALKGNPLGIFYSVAQTPYLVGYFLFAGVSIGLFESSFITRYGYVIGTFLELVTFSLALGYRFRLLELEKFNSQADLLTLQGSLNEQLRSQVDERTSELAAANEAVQRINSDYEALLQSVRVGVASLGKQGDISFKNSTYALLADDIPQLTQTINELANGSENMGVEEIVVPASSGGQRHLLVNSAERLSGEGSYLGCWVIVTDVSAMRAQEASLNHASKMATLGEMSTGMAHELNQPLNAIRLTMENIRAAFKRGKVDLAFLQSKFERIDDQISRASKLVSLMRTYGRVATSTFEPFDVCDSVGGVSDLMGDQLRLDQIVLKTVEPGGMRPRVNGNESQFEQVLLNLVSNARDAIVNRSPGGGSITIDVIPYEAECQVTVSDTGGGIPEDVIDRIFEPFFTTKAIGEGTGLGGAISYGIIQEMEGTITATNNSEGAVIEITLPLHTG